MHQQSQIPIAKIIDSICIRPAVVVSKRPMRWIHRNTKPRTHLKKTEESDHEQQGRAQGHPLQLLRNTNESFYYYGKIKLN